MIALFLSLVNLKSHTTPAPIIEPDPEYFYSEMWRQYFHTSELEFAGRCEGVARYHVVVGDEGHRTFTGMVVYEDQMWAA